MFQSFSRVGREDFQIGDDLELVYSDPYELNYLITMRKIPKDMKNDNENLEEKAILSLKTQFELVFKKIEEEKIEQGKLLRQEGIKKACITWIETKLPKYLNELVKFNTNSAYVKGIVIPVTDFLLFGFTGADVDFLFSFLKTVLNSSNHLSCVRTEVENTFLLGFRNYPFKSKEDVLSFDSLLSATTPANRIIWSAI